MNFEDVEKLINLMQRYDLSELQVKEKDWEFSACRGAKPQQVIMTSSAQPVHATGAPVQTSGAAEVPAGKKLKEITSPIVGTFYRTPSPDQPPFKEVGDPVNAEEVVCIIEAMKVMNEIKAGVTGTVRKILVENTTPVEYGQPLFLVEI